MCEMVDRGDEAHIHCGEAPLAVGLLGVLFHPVGGWRRIKSHYFHEDWPENTHAAWQCLESEKPQQPGAMGQTEYDEIGRDKGHPVLTSTPV